LIFGSEGFKPTENQTSVFNLLFALILVERGGPIDVAEAFVDLYDQFVDLPFHLLVEVDLFPGRHQHEDEYHSFASIRVSIQEKLESPQPIEATPDDIRIAIDERCRFAMPIMP
jgi:hypothetical protein